MEYKFINKYIYDDINKEELMIKFVFNLENLLSYIMEDF